MIARLDVGNIAAHRKYLYTQLMSGNSRVAEKGHFTEITGVICATDTYSVDLNQCLTQSGLFRFLKIDRFKSFWFS